MSYVRRQRLSWARIKLSCLWYLYFKNINQVSLKLKLRFFRILVVSKLPLGFSKGYLLFTFQCTLCSHFFPWTEVILTHVKNHVNTFSKNYLIFFSWLFFRIKIANLTTLRLAHILSNLSHFVNGFWNIFEIFLWTFCNNSQFLETTFLVCLLMLILSCHLMLFLYLLWQQSCHYSY